LSGINNTIIKRTTGGVWSTSNAAVADVGNRKRNCNRHYNGAATITYTIGSGCVATANITVNPFAANSGNPNTCVGFVTTLAQFCEWWYVERSNPTVAGYRRRDGYCSGLSPETSVITYSLVTDVMLQQTVNVMRCRQ